MDKSFIWVAKCFKCSFEWGSTSNEQFFGNLYKDPLCPTCRIFLDISKKPLEEDDGLPE
jgi:hypothetical protein